jgi:hypothetical protein
VFESPDVHRARTRRGLVCPYCNGKQAIPPQPGGSPSSAGNIIGCAASPRPEPSVPRIGQTKESSLRRAAPVEISWTSEGSLLMGAVNRPRHTSQSIV